MRDNTSVPLTPGTCVLWLRDHRCLYKCEVTSVKAKLKLFFFWTIAETDKISEGSEDGIFSLLNINLTKNVLLDKKEGCSLKECVPDNKKCPLYGFKPENSVD